MLKKNFNSSIDEKTKLGKFIRDLRNDKRFSLRKFAEKIGLAASNLTCIENGKNAPSPEIYAKIISDLKPDIELHHTMDILYSKIRNFPPPDVCDILLQNEGLGDKLKLLGDTTLTTTQLSAIEKFFISLKEL